MIMAHGRKDKNGGNYEISSRDLTQHLDRKRIQR